MYIYIYIEGERKGERGGERERGRERERVAIYTKCIDIC